MKMKKAIIFYKDSILDRATLKNFFLSIFELVSSLNRSHRMAIDERELVQLRESFVNHFCIILKMHFVLKINVASQMKACNKLFI